MKFILIEAGKKAQVIEHKGKIDYKDIKRYLGIESPVTVVTRKLGDKYYDLWADDEGLLKEEDKIIAGVLSDNRGEELLVGNIAIFNSDKEGNTVGLTDAEINDILANHVVKMDDFNLCNRKEVDEDYEVFGYFGEETCTLKAHSEWLVYAL